MIPTCRSSRRTPFLRPSCADRSFDLHVEQGRCGLGALERLEVRVRGRDHIAAAVAVHAHGPDRLADLQIDVCLDDAGEREHLVERADPLHPPGGERSRLGREEANRERLLELRQHELVGKLVAERHSDLHLDQIDAGRDAHEVGHLAAGDARGTLDDDHPAVPRGDQLRKRDARPQAECVHGVHGHSLRFVELLAVGRRRIHVDPANAEADAGGPQPVGQCQRNRRAVSSDDDPVHLDAVDELFENRFPGRRRQEHLQQVRVDLVERLDTEDGALSTRVGRFEHGRKPDLVGGPARLGDRPDRGIARLGHTRVREPGAHRDLVRHQVRGLDADPRQPSRLGNRRDDGNGPVGADGHHAVEVDPRGGLDHRGCVGEVDDFCDVRLGEPGRLGVAIDCDHPQAELLGLEDRPALVAPCADEENGLHAGGMVLRRFPAASLPEGAGSAGDAANVPVAPVSHREPHGRRERLRPELRAQHRRSARSALAVAQSRRQRRNRAPAVVAELVQLVLPDDEPGPLEAVDPVARRMDGLLGEQLAGSGRHRDEQSRAHAAQLAQRRIEGVASLGGETVLRVVAPDMLEGRDRDREVESTVLERQVAEVGLNARQPGHLGAHEVDAGQLGRAETEQPGEVRRLGERVADIEHAALARVPRQAPGNLDRPLVGSWRGGDVARSLAGGPLSGGPGDGVVQVAELLVLGGGGELAQERRARHPAGQARFGRRSLVRLDRPAQHAAPDRVEIFGTGLEPRS